jgi:hypothetical protein
MKFGNQLTNTGSPIAGYLLAAYGGEHSTLKAFHPAIFYAGSMAAGAAMLVGVVKMMLNKSPLKKLRIFKESCVEWLPWIVKLGMRILGLLVHFNFVGVVPEEIKVCAINPKVIKAIAHAYTRDLREKTLLRYLLNSR